MTIIVVTLSWIMGAGMRHWYAVLLSGLAGTIVTALSLFVFARATLLRDILQTRPAIAFMIGNALLGGSIAIVGTLVVQKGLRIARRVSGGLILSSVIGAVLFSLYFPRKYGVLLGASFFGAYPVIAVGWGAALLFCPPYFDHVLLTPTHDGLRN